MSKRRPGPSRQKPPEPDAFALVYAAPDDDAPREAAAAALDADGDPRGEFIRLQLARARGEKPSKAQGSRERALLKAHATEWAAPLADALVQKDLAWERGFPVSGRLNFNGAWARRRGREKPPHPLAAVPALATIRRLRLSSPNMLLSTREIEQIVRLPALRTLREVESLPRALLIEIADGAEPFALERIRLLESGGADGADAEAAERARVASALERGAGLPRLADLELSWHHAKKPDDYGWLFSTALGRRLRALRIGGYYLGRELPPWKRVLDARAGEIALEELELHHGMFAVSLRRNESGFRILRGTLEDDRYGAGRRELVEVLTKLGSAAFDEVAVEGFAP